MIHRKLLVATRQAILFLLFIHFNPFNGSAQLPAPAKLDKMPVDLETDYALSALPPHLREDATIYLLDPKQGYYVAREGSNRFTCLVSRTEWEWAEFRDDHAYPVCYDLEGTLTIIPVYLDVAQMRASGKYTPEQLRDTVVQRIKKGTYKAPSRPGISYMLGPVMRTYPNKKELMTYSLPHYMFYAPYLTNADIGASSAWPNPSMFNPGDFILGTGKGPFGYMIMVASDAETARIMKENEGLLKRLVAYRSYFKVPPVGAEQKSQHH
jgi:hypothetical protein